MNDKTIEEIKNVLADLNTVEILSHIDLDFTVQKDLENFLKSVKNEIFGIIKKYKAQEQRWIPVEKALPTERDSMFAKFKGTDKWGKAMFEKTSDEVIVACEVEDNAHRKTVLVITSHTNDGKWKIETEKGFTKKRVIAWQPLPEYHFADVDKKEGD